MCVNATTLVGAEIAEWIEELEEWVVALKRRGTGMESDVVANILKN